MRYGYLNSKSELTGRLFVGRPCKGRGWHPFPARLPMVLRNAADFAAGAPGSQVRRRDSGSPVSSKPCPGCRTSPAGPSRSSPLSGPGPAGAALRPFVAAPGRPRAAGEPGWGGAGPVGGWGKRRRGFAVSPPPGGRPRRAAVAPPRRQPPCCWAESLRGGGGAGPRCPGAGRGRHGGAGRTGGGGEPALIWRLGRGMEGERAGGPAAPAESGTSEAFAQLWADVMGILVSAAGTGCGAASGSRGASRGTGRVAERRSLALLPRLGGHGRRSPLQDAGCLRHLLWSLPELERVLAMWACTSQKHFFRGQKQALHQWLL